MGVENQLNFKIFNQDFAFYFQIHHFKIKAKSKIISKVLKSIHFCNVNTFLPFTNFEKPKFLGFQRLLCKF